MTPARRRWRPLVAIAVAVLGAHWVVLSTVPGVLRPHRPATMASLHIRAVAAAQPVAEPPAAPAPIPAAKPSPPAAPVKPRAAPAPAPAIVPEPVREPAPTPPTTAPAASPPERAAAALAIPGSARLRYRVQARARGVEIPGQAEFQWRHDGASYEARLEVTAPLLPTRLQRSTGRITAQGLAPTRFSDRTRSEEAAHFDHEAGKVVFSTNRPETPLLPGAQDRLSVLLQLGALIAGEPSRYAVGTTVSLQTASTREAEVWLFSVEADEELALASGIVRGLKLTRQPRKEFDQKVELWLAPGMDYVPVRLRLTQPNGDWLDLQWSATDKG